MSACLTGCALILACSDEGAGNTNQTRAGDDPASAASRAADDGFEAGASTKVETDETSFGDPGDDADRLDDEMDDPSDPDDTSLADDEPVGDAAIDEDAAESPILSGDAGVSIEGTGSVDAGHTTDPPPATGYGGGERVKVRVGVTPDGNEFPLSLHDDALGIDCMPRQTAEGLLCVPAMLVNGEIYIDSDCQTPATVLSDECELPEYVAVQTSSPQLCSGLYEANAYRLSTKHDTGVRYNSDACYESAYDPERYSMYELEPLPLDNLPMLALEAVQSSDSDARETLFVRGDDGAFSSLSLSINGHSCQLVEVGESLRCIAGSPIISAGGYFSDAGCSEDVATAWVSHPDCDSAGYALFYAPDPTDSCKTSIGVREVVGQLDPAAQLYGGNAESCYETVQSDRGAYYLLGSEAEPDDLPEVTRRLVGEGRLQRIEYRFSDAPDSPPAYSPRAYDTTLESECNFSQFSDGKVRCLPSDATHLTASPFFADAECTAKLASIQDCLATLPPRIGYLPTTEQCGIYSAAIDELYEFGDVHSGATYRQTNAGCEAVERLDDVTYFVLSLADPDAVLGGIDSQLR